MDVTSVATDGRRLNRKLAAAAREARNLAGLTQVELAEKAEVDRAYIGGLEGGRINVIGPEPFNKLHRVLRFPGYVWLEYMGYETDTVKLTQIDPSLLGVVMQIPRERHKDVTHMLTLYVGGLS